MFITHNTKKLSAQFNEGAGNHFVLFLYGGGKKSGKEKFTLWQDKLAEEGIGSLSFDFSGMGNSGGDMAQESLQKRIREAETAALWLKNKAPSARFSVYGLSMGGYVALGLVHSMPDMFSSLVLQASAAYSQEAHTLCFDETFTREIRKENSWHNSFSFGWLEEYTGRVLFIASEEDEVIPAPIIERYKNILKEKEGSQFVTIKNAPHNIWGNDKEHAMFRKQAYNHLSQFLLDSGTSPHS